MAEGGKAMESNKVSDMQTEEIELLDRMTNSELRAALIRSIQRESTLRSELDSLKPIPVIGKCFFLQTIPIEVRNHIYRYLLVTDILSTSRAVQRPKVTNDRFTDQYGIHPEILQTCKQISKEASIVLYEMNVFIMECHHETDAASPIFRHQFACTEAKTSVLGRNMHTCKSMQKIKQWKVFVGTHKMTSALSPTVSFVYFCRAICDASVRSLRVDIIPKGSATAYDHNPVLLLAGQYYPLADVLAPLRMLRNIPKLEFGPVEGDDVPLYLNSGPIFPQSPHILKPQLEAELKQLVEENSKVVHVWKRYDRLLAYARAFERNPVYKETMNPQYGEVAERRETGIWECRDHSVFKAGKEWNPVEEMLDYASYASEINSRKRFNAARAKILEYLEPQYQRILAASMEMALFVKVRKTEYGLFGVETDVDVLPALNAAFFQLQAYAASTQRDLTTSMKVQNAISLHGLETAYLDLPRVKWMGKLRRLLWQQVNDNVTLLSIFKRCVDDIDAQYLEIRNARKRVFEDDPGNARKVVCMSLVDWVQPWRCDEHIDWTVNEPVYRPVHDPDYNPNDATYEDESSGSDSDDSLDQDADHGASSDTVQGCEES